MSLALGTADSQGKSWPRRKLPSHKLLRGNHAMTTQIRRNDSPSLYCLELRTANWEQMVGWYREVLGLRVLVRVVDDGYALLEAGETRLAILRRAQPGGPSRRISLAFEVRDVPELVSRLKLAGSDVSHPPRDPEGLRDANTSDPDGNRIRLFSWPEKP
jgi:predicted enzyme related to lactoylglutathione lyase